MGSSGFFPALVNTPLEWQWQFILVSVFQVSYIICGWQGDRQLEVLQVIFSNYKCPIRVLLKYGEWKKLERMFLIEKFITSILLMQLMLVNWFMAFIHFYVFYIFYRYKLTIKPIFCIQIFIYMDVHCIIIYNQKLETTQMPIN